MVVINVHYMELTVGWLFFTNFLQLFAWKRFLVDLWGYDDDGGSLVGGDCMYGKIDLYWKLIATFQDCLCICVYVYNRRGKLGGRGSGERGEEGKVGGTWYSVCEKVMLAINSKFIQVSPLATLPSLY